MISANGGLPAHGYTPQLTPRRPRGSEPASAITTTIPSAQHRSHFEKQEFSRQNQQSHMNHTAIKSLFVECGVEWGGGVHFAGKLEIRKRRQGRGAG